MQSDLHQLHLGARHLFVVLSDDDRRRIGRVGQPAAEAAVAHTLEHCGDGGSSLAEDLIIVDIIPLPPPKQSRKPEAMLLEAHDWRQPSIT